MHGGLRAVLGESDPSARDTLSVTLEHATGVKVAATCGSCSELVEASMHAADALIVSSQVLDDGPVEAVLPLLSDRRLRVIVLAETVSLEAARRAFAAGAAGYLDRHTSADELRAAVRAVADGGVAVSPALMAAIVEDWAQGSGPAPSRAPLLTRREQELLEVMAEGLSSKTIARRLGIRLKTVENHKTRVFYKLGAQGQADAVAIGRDVGLLGDAPGAGGDELASAS